MRLFSLPVLTVSLIGLTTVSAAAPSTTTPSFTTSTTRSTTTSSTTSSISSLSTTRATPLCVGAIGPPPCASPGPQTTYISVPCFPNTGVCYPTNFYAAQDLGQFSRSNGPFDSQIRVRCQAACDSQSKCASYVATENVTPDGQLATSTCFFYTIRQPIPRQCADAPSRIIAYLKQGVCPSINHGLRCAFDDFSIARGGCSNNCVCDQRAGGGGVCDTDFGFNCSLQSCSSDDNCPDGFGCANSVGYTQFCGSPKCVPVTGCTTTFSGKRGLIFKS